MQIRYTKRFLSKLESIIEDSGYLLRYGKGNFKTGYCLLKDKKVAVVNKYYPLEGKINSLIDLIKSIDPDIKQLNEKNSKVLLELSQTEIRI